MELFIQNRPEHYTQLRAQESHKVPYIKSLGIIRSFEV